MPNDTSDNISDQDRQRRHADKYKGRRDTATIIAAISTPILAILQLAGGGKVISMLFSIPALAFFKAMLEETRRRGELQKLDSQTELPPPIPPPDPNPNAWMDLPTGKDIPPLEPPSEDLEAGGFYDKKVTHLEALKPGYGDERDSYKKAGCIIS